MIKTNKTTAAILIPTIAPTFIMFFSNLVININNIINILTHTIIIVYKNKMMCFYD